MGLRTTKGRWLQAEFNEIRDSTAWASYTRPMMPAQKKRPPQVSGDLGRDAMPPNNDLKFQVNCDAGAYGQLRVASETLVVNVGQTIVRDGHAEIWDSVVIKCSEERDGSCTVHVLLCNPDWEEPMQLACLRSYPDTGLSNQVSLFCHLTSEVGR